MQPVRMLMFGLVCVLAFTPTSAVQIDAEGGVAAQDHKKKLVRRVQAHTHTQPWLAPDAAAIDMKRWKAEPEQATWPAVPNDEVHQMIDGWYSKYGADLAKVRARASQWKGKPQSGDLEMSVTYLRLRATKPEVVWECAPADGWSSFFILSALKDNGAGHLYSFGLEPEKTVFNYMSSCCSDLAALWSYREGFLEDFTAKYDFQNGKGGFQDSKGYVEVPRPEYVFMDALHNYEFGKMYADVLLSKIVGHTHVSLHDAFRDGWSISTPEEKELFKAHPHRPMPEAQGVIDTLGTKICRGFTVSRNYNADFQNTIVALDDKYLHGKSWMHDMLNKPAGSSLDSSFWFEMGCPSS